MPTQRPEYSSNLPATVRTTDPKPFLFTVVDANGTDSGLRFVELDKDDYDDLIVRGQTNNGVWFADDHMWGQNEDTNRLLDGVDRRTFRN
ncbi:MAG: hypothetical protein R3C56_19605 [Pirellulaceae bacterium]